MDKKFQFVILKLLDQQGEASILLTHENLKGFGITQAQLEAEPYHAAEKMKVLLVEPCRY